MMLISPSFLYYLAEASANQSGLFVCADFAFWDYCNIFDIMVVTII